MKILNDTTQKLSEAFMHYVCMRLNFRSTVLKDGLPLNRANLCLENCCPAKA